MVRQSNGRPFVKRIEEFRGCGDVPYILGTGAKDIALKKQREDTVGEGIHGKVHARGQLIFEGLADICMYMVTS
jgi:hypothetical protein